MRLRSVLISLGTDLQNKLRAQGLPWEISKAFDNSAVIGTFIPLEQAGM